MKERIKSFVSSNKAIFLIGVISGILVFSSLLKEKGNYKVISSDGIGYYSYLPNTFLTQTLDEQTADKRFYIETNGKGVNKYYVGTAVSMSPFFALGHVLAKARGEDSTGFELSYQAAISLAAWVYLMGGLFFFQGILRFFKFPEFIILALLLLTFFGSNLLEYSLWQPSMSHVYSFFWITGFLYFIKKYSIDFKPKWLYGSAFFLAMVVLVRPLNGIVIFSIPFLVENKAGLIQFFNSLLKNKRLFFSLLIGVITLIIQSIFWHLQCGEWWVWSYANEGFEFASPHLQEFLFSFRKGAFVYTPVLLLSIVGITTLVQKNKFQGISILLFTIGLIYLLSSWWNWYYGPSFGQRPLVEFYALFVILIGYLLIELSIKWQKIITWTFIFACVGLNLIQTYQYNKDIISSWDMNAEKYGYTFLKTDLSYQNVLGGNDDIMLYKAKLDTVFSQVFNFESWENNSNSHRFRLQEPELGFRDYTNTEFNFDLTIPCDSSFLSGRGIYMLVDLNILDKKISKSNGALFVIEISDSLGEKYHYGTFPIRSIPPRKTEVWKPNFYSIEIKEVKNASDQIKIYFWNKVKEEFWIDDVGIKIVTVD